MRSAESAAIASIGRIDADTYSDPRFFSYRRTTLAGEKDGATRAEKILALEIAVATDQWTPVQNRDPIATYNRHSVQSAAEFAPKFDWKAYLTESKLPAGDFIVRQPTYATALGGHLHGSDLAVWKDYLIVRTIGAYARVLPAAFVEASFDFNSRTLRGTEALRPRWKRAVQETDNAMGEAIGAAYVARQNLYTTLAARQEHDAGRGASVVHLLFSPLVRFLKFYVLRLGFLDGLPGLVHISIGCMNSYMKHAKLIEITRNSGNSGSGS